MFTFLPVNRILLLLLFCVLFWSSSLLFPKQIFAVEDCTFNLDGTGINWVDRHTNTFYYDSNLNSKNLVFRFVINNIDWWKGKSTDYTSVDYKFVIDRGLLYGDVVNAVYKSPDLTVFEYKNDPNITLADADYKIKLLGIDDKDVLCTGEYHIVPKYSCNIEVSSDRADQAVDSYWKVKISNIIIGSKQVAAESIRFQSNINGLGDTPKVWTGKNYDFLPKFPSSGFTSTGFVSDIGKVDAGPSGTDYFLHVVTFPNLPTTKPQIMCSTSFHVYPRDAEKCTQSPCFVGGKGNLCNDPVCFDCSYCRLHPTPLPTNSPFCQACQNQPDPCKERCQSCPFCQVGTSPSPQPVPSLAPLCDRLDAQFVADCKACVDAKHGIWTAIGCLPTQLEVILKDYVFVYGIGIAGGIAFLYFLYGVFLIITSSGVAEKVAEGREIIISALSGLLLIIFSIFLLRVIGVDILKIPGFV